MMINTSTFSFESLSSDNDDEVSFSDDDIEEDDGVFDSNQGRG